MLGLQLVSRSEHSGDFFRPSLEPKGNHRRGHHHRLPAVAVVSPDLDDDVSLSESMSDQLNELAGGSHFLRHAMAFREIRGNARAPSNRKRSSDPISERSTYSDVSRGKICGLKAPARDHTAPSNSNDEAAA
jgi:hypothetical protein